MIKPIIAFKTIAFTIFIPGIVVIIFPLILSTLLPNKFEIGEFYAFGYLFIVIGIVFYTYSVLSFLFNGEGTPMIFFMRKLERIFGVEPSKLVQNGLYNYTRNPMYLGVVLIVIGEGLLIQNILILLWGILAFSIFHLVVSFLEEPHLLKKHGQNYKDYMKKTPRWIGIRKPFFQRNIEETK
ncbi:MAG: methyltransferase family protein [Candidatus Hodarchaeales archaeon]|jgi:protein-S-isoprenylcysteine O-methyltransferase Ste14